MKKIRSGQAKSNQTHRAVSTFNASAVDSICFSLICKIFTYFTHNSAQRSNFSPLLSVIFDNNLWFTSYSLQSYNWVTNSDIIAIEVSSAVLPLPEKK